MLRRVIVRLLPAALAAGLLLSAGCKGKTAGAGGGPTGKETVRGKVTYNGAPVPYGFVLFFNPDSMDTRTGSLSPVAVGMIGPDGSYEVAQAPQGQVQICIATDPDAEPASLSMPRSMGPPGMPGGPPGGEKPEMKAPPGAPRRAANPANSPAALLSAAQQDTLRDIHAKYGATERSKLHYVVKEGVQTHNIDLK